MERDWEIVDDSDVEIDAVEANDTRLDQNRMETIARERRAATRMRQWRVGVIVFAAIVGIVLVVRAVEWLIAGEHHAWCVTVGVIGACLIVGALVRGAHTT